jgi:hypothetical protein
MGANGELVARSLAVTGNPPTRARSRPLAAATRLCALELAPACTQSSSLALGLGFKDFASGERTTKFDSVQGSLLGKHDGVTLKES